MVRVCSELAQSGIAHVVQYGSAVVIAAVCLAIWPMMRLMRPTTDQRKFHVELVERYGRLKTTAIEFRIMFRDFRRIPNWIQAYVGIWSVVLIAAVFELPGAEIVGGAMSLVIVLGIWVESVYASVRDA